MNGLPTLSFFCLVQTASSLSIAVLQSANNMAGYRSFQYLDQSNAQIDSSIIAKNSLMHSGHNNGIKYPKCTVTVTRMVESSTAVTRTQEKYAASPLHTSLGGSKGGIRTTFRQPTDDGRPHHTPPGAYHERDTSLNEDLSVLEAKICQSEPGSGTIKQLCDEALTDGMDLRLFPALSFICATFLTNLNLALITTSVACIVERAVAETMPQSSQRAAVCPGLRPRILWTIAEAVVGMHPKCTVHTEARWDGGGRWRCWTCSAPGSIALRVRAP
jgi:hypothetical protein